MHSLQRSCGDILFLRAITTSLVGCAFWHSDSTSDLEHVLLWSFLPDNLPVVRFTFDFLWFTNLFMMSDGELPSKLEIGGSTSRFLQTHNRRIASITFARCREVAIGTRLC